MKIGLALSGGGVRATVFHLGALARLARQSLIENITFLSTVSGGSLAVALVWACSGNVWPGSDAFLRCTIPTARRLLTAHGLNRAYLRYMLLFPWVFRHGRAGALAGALQDRWSVGGLLSDLPDNPRWIINATCYETGKNWRFMKKRMGDYVIGYVASPQLPIALAVAASSAVPGLVGSLKLHTSRFEWFAFDKMHTPRRHAPRFRTLTLWDGGVYDNLGVEALFQAGWRLQGWIRLPDRLRCIRSPRSRDPQVSRTAAPTEHRDRPGSRSPRPCSGLAPPAKPRCRGVSENRQHRRAYLPRSQMPRNGGAHP